MNFQYSPQNIFIIILALLIFGFFYFLPAIIGRKKRNAGALFFCNLFFGGTGIGWIICLIWALSGD